MFERATNSPFFFHQYCQIAQFQAQLQSNSLYSRTLCWFEPCHIISTGPRSFSQHKVITNSPIPEACLVLDFRLLFDCNQHKFEFVEMNLRLSHSVCWLYADKLYANGAIFFFFVLSFCILIGNNSLHWFDSFKYTSEWNVWVVWFSGF